MPTVLITSATETLVAPSGQNNRNTDLGLPAMFCIDRCPGLRQQKAPEPEEFLVNAPVHRGSSTVR
ncbi:MAG: hypothetical protein NTX49_00245 [Chlamydiae bacterium]|nr:hypothetical protein [Chlamydiota bacterium]